MTTLLPSKADVKTPVDISAKSAGQKPAARAAKGGKRVFTGASQQSVALAAANGCQPDASGSDAVRAMFSHFTPGARQMATLVLGAWTWTDLAKAFFDVVPGVQVEGDAVVQLAGASLLVTLAPGDILVRGIWPN